MTGISCAPSPIRNALAHVPKGQHTVVAAAIRQAFNQPDKKAAVETWHHVADQLRARWPKLAETMRSCRPHTTRVGALMRTVCAASGRVSLIERSVARALPRASGVLKVS